jgi:hypothetical protein
VPRPAPHPPQARRAPAPARSDRRHARAGPPEGVNPEGSDPGARHAESPRPGALRDTRGLRLTLRGLALALILLLALNPPVPGAPAPPEGVRAPDRWVVLELHPALAASSGAEAGSDLVLDEAIREARSRLAGGGALALAGPADPEALSEAVLDTLGPGGLMARDGDLARTAARLAEAGARELVLVTPLRDASGALAAALEALAVGVEIVQVGGNGPNASVVAIEPPGESGEEGHVVVAGEGPGAGLEGTLVTVGVEAAGTEVSRVQLPLPAPGTRARVPFTLPPTAAGADAGVEIVATVELEGDVYAPDDRLRVVLAAPGASGLVLVSSRPDGEPRVLLPLLERATGLVGEGWIRVAPDRYLALGGPGGAARFADGEALAQAMARARLLVVQWGPGAPPPGGAAVVAEHPARIQLVVPGDAGGAGPAPAPSAAWRVDPEFPPSPLSGFLSGVLPPGGSALLAPVLAPAENAAPPSAGAAPATAPIRSLPVLRYRSGGADRGAPGVETREAEGWREVVFQGTGFWRWAGGDPAAAALHRALFAGAAAWVLAGGEADAGGGPPGGAAQAADPARRALLVPPGDPADYLRSAPAGGPRGEESGPVEGRLRTHPLPWFVVLTLLGVEWILRRRAGLR